MPVWGFLYFQDASSYIMEFLIYFHDYSMIIMIMIMFLVGYLLFMSYKGYSYNLGLFEGQELEMIWTMLPAIFLLFIAFPSLRLLYLMEEVEVSDLTIKLLGRQWYWSYEYSDFDLLSFDSYMEESETFRMLDVDNCLMIPCNLGIRMIITGADVIHSWTIPSLGVKADAIPGRLNQLMLMFTRVGKYFGECSEICGANHSFMPIMMMVIPHIDWLKGWFND